MIIKILQYNSNITVLANDMANYLKPGNKQKRFLGIS